MAVVIKRVITIPMYGEKNDEGVREVVAKIFIKVPPKEVLLKDRNYLKAANSENIDELESTYDYLVLIKDCIVGWENIKVSEGEGSEVDLEYSKENATLVAPLILEDIETFSKFGDALRGITEKK